MEWRKNLKNKPVKYWIRDEIEEIIKEEHIDRNRFGEFSKFKYQDIITKFYYTFVDYEKYPKVELAYCWLHFRDNLTVKSTIKFSGEWKKFLQQVNKLIGTNADRKLYMILSQAWVYEGYAKEIFDVLGETDGLLEDFYIVSPDFDWVICYSDDGECASLYRREHKD